MSAALEGTLPPDADLQGELRARRAFNPRSIVETTKAAINEETGPLVISGFGASADVRPKARPRRWAAMAVLALSAIAVAAALNWPAASSDAVIVPSQPLAAETPVQAAEPEREPPREAQGEPRRDTPPPAEAALRATPPASTPASSKETVQPSPVRAKEPLRMARRVKAKRAPVRPPVIETKERPVDRGEREPKKDTLDPMRSFP
jgi:hypothetical protein